VSRCEPEEKAHTRILQATHIFPTSRLSEWKRGVYQRVIGDTRPAHEIGETKMFSPQNGLLLSGEMHLDFDDFNIGVDPNVSYFL
jgi:hypothetical protein